MKNIRTARTALYAALFCVVAGLSGGCTDFEELNTDPNNPSDIPTNMLFAGASKYIMDNIYDNWFSGRQCLVYMQYWAQRNYTEEDRYQIRESVNNSYFNYLYRGISNLEEIIAFNEDPATAVKMSAYGANCNQIAAALTLRAWTYLVMTDTWGAIPYHEVNRLKREKLYYPKYVKQEEIYTELLSELKEAAEMFDESQSGFTGGDAIYDGDVEKWKKFANSLRCRVAVHLSKVDTRWKTYIDEAVASGVFESNDDNASFQYSATAPYQCLFYRGTFVSARSDFTITRSFADILKGQRDTLNNKQHPWEGTQDPRLPIYTTARADKYIGIPYGIPSNSVTSDMRNTAPNWYNAPPLFFNPDFAVPLMTYAELQFILCEKENYDDDKFEEGIRSSIEYWSDASGIAVEATDIDDYVTTVQTAFGTNKEEALALQKYIALYINGTEAWTEYRRTGYPTQLLKPDEKSTETLNFTTLPEGEDVSKGDIISRVKYPTNEKTLNAANWAEAVSWLQDGTNNYYSKMFWDVRTATDPHPANK